MIAFGKGSDFGETTCFLKQDRDILTRNTPSFLSSQIGLDSLNLIPDQFDA